MENTTIKEVSIDNFKCFKNEKFEFKNLTILTGENSSGKSSLIQALLLAGNKANERSSELNEYLFSIGDAKDFFNKNFNKKEFKIEVAFNNSEKDLLSVKLDDKWHSEHSITRSLFYPDNLSYLNADRNRIQHINKFYNMETNREFGIKSDNVASYFEHSKMLVIEDYLIKDMGSYTLETQVNYWLSYITGIEDINIKSEKITTTSIKSFFEINGDIFQPENVGTGLSHLFAILVICLSAQKGNIIIIENPEIHLHPKSQANLGEFFAFISSKGIQLILETHNDHLINKVCYEINKGNLSNNDVIIHYFEYPYKETTIYLDKRGHFINKNGDLIDFPDGFFDATLSELLEIGG